MLSFIILVRILDDSMKSAPYKHLVGYLSMSKIDQNIQSDGQRIKIRWQSTMNLPKLFRDSDMRRNGRSSK